MPDPTPTTERLPTKEEADLTIAETEKVRAETVKLRAEAAKAQSEADNAANMAIVSRYAREAVERETAASLASNDYNRVYSFNGYVNESSVKCAINRLTEWHRVYPGQPIEIIFTSGGGSVVDGMALFDFILDLRAQGHRITTSTLGVAASMAGILLQAGDVRTMGREAWLMIHEASFHAEGKIGEVEDTVEWIKKVQERVLQIFASRSTMSVDEIREKWGRRNWWIDSDEALRLGLVDALR
ncbi:MAG: ATP-dependent Clp protease proteolytic subunit [Actinomycetota bacterium]